MKFFSAAFFLSSSHVCRQVSNPNFAGHPSSPTSLQALPPTAVDAVHQSNAEIVLASSSSKVPLTLSNLPSNSNFASTKNIHAYLRDWLVPPAFAATTQPPSEEEVKLLQGALGAFYGERNPVKAEELLSKAITAWERQNPDEKAALYRVRGDCYLEMLRPEDAAKDYTIAINFLDGPGGELADPNENPEARLGRARAVTSLGKLTTVQAEQAVNDYKAAFLLSARGEWDTEKENLEDGAMKNPYAAWEWGTARRAAGDYKGAAESHALAAYAFQEVGDKPRSVMASLDAGIDLAATDDIAETKSVLEKAIKSTIAVESRDVLLLSRVIAKECEARIALASVLWGSNDKAGAENQLGEACLRFDQLEADSRAREAARVKSGAMPPPKIVKLKFSIDDSIGGGEASCSRFKNEKFLDETLQWPSSLQAKVVKLNKLGQ